MALIGDINIPIDHWRVLDCFQISDIYGIGGRDVLNHVRDILPVVL